MFLVFGLAPLVEELLKYGANPLVCVCVCVLVCVRACVCAVC